MDWRLAIAAAMLALTGIGFGVPGLLGLRSVAAGQGVPLVMGYPSYGGGPFERHGVATTVPLLVAFLLVCALEVVAAALVLRASRAGAILALALLVPEAIFWWGFALPIPPILAAARTALLAW